MQLVIMIKWSEFFLKQTKTEIFYILIFAILGPQIAPTSVGIRVDNSTCVTLSWQPPQWPNGPITGYQVS